VNKDVYNSAPEMCPGRFLAGHYLRRPKSQHRRCNIVDDTTWAAAVMSSVPVQSAMQHDSTVLVPGREIMTSEWIHYEVKQLSDRFRAAAAAAK